MGRHDGHAQDDDPEIAGGRQESSVADVRTRVWELHLRGMARSRIAEEVGLHRVTVGRYIAACLREMGAEQRQKREQMLAAAVARMRRVQEQAWADHDADDERERSVLALVLGESEAEADSGGGEKREERGRSAGGGRTSPVMARYQSQRSHYLRVILDAEREIARLCGLYEAGLALDGAVVFRLERVSEVGSRPPGRDPGDCVEIEGDSDAGGG